MHREARVSSRREGVGHCARRCSRHFQAAATGPRIDWCCMQRGEVVHDAGESIAHPRQQFSDRNIALGRLCSHTLNGYPRTRCTGSCLTTTISAYPAPADKLDGCPPLPCDLTAHCPAVFSGSRFFSAALPPAVRPHNKRVLVFRLRLRPRLPCKRVGQR
jgi:hypothetical protein